MKKFQNKKYETIYRSNFTVFSQGSDSKGNDFNTFEYKYLNGAELKGTNHRVFFQNAEGNINMGVFFNDPEVELDDIYWYHVLTHEIFKSLRRGFQIVDLYK